MPDNELPERFEIREEIARTERAVRWRAFDNKLHREVLLEVPGPGARSLTAHDRQLELREARMTARVRHPRVLHLDEIDDSGAAPLLVFEARAGESLEAALARAGRLEPDQVLAIGRDLAEASQAVHAEGVVHRGIAASNVLLEAADGRAVLMGFTFAKPVDRDAGMSSIDYRARSRGGRVAEALPEHPAPEQLAGQAADARSDVFGLGCLLYRCLTGKPALPPDAVTWIEPEDPAKLAPEAPKFLVQAIRKCLARSPLARFQTMLDLRAALEEPAEKAGSPTRRNVLAASAAAAVAVAAFVVWPGGGGSRGGEFVGRGSGRGPEPVPVYGPSYHDSRALVIGIDYRENGDHRTLNNAERDARDIHRALIELGWPADHVDLLTGEEATASAILEKVDKLERGAAREDQVFFYFAGHGERHWTSGGFIVPADGGKTEYSGRSWIGFDRINKLFSCEAKHVLVALDCCNSGRAEPRAPSRGRPPTAPAIDDRIYARYLTAPARQLLTSAKGSATDGKGEHSPFAQGILDSLAAAPESAAHVYARIMTLIEAQGIDQRCDLDSIGDTDSEFWFLRR